MISFWASLILVLLSISAVIASVIAAIVASCIGIHRLITKPPRRKQD